LANIICFANQKGGVGKSTTVANLAGCFATGGRSVLVIDTDPQANVSLALGVQPEKAAADLYDLLVGSRPAAEAIAPTSIDNCMLIPASARLERAEEMLVKEDEQGKLRLRDCLLHRHGARLRPRPEIQRFDYVLIDCPPHLGRLTINALAAADYVIIPVQCEVLALYGVQRLINSVINIKRDLNPRLTILGALLTMYTDTIHCRAVAEQIRAGFNGYGYVFKNPIKRSIRISEAVAAELPCVLYPPASAAARSFKAVAREIEKLLAQSGGAAAN